MHKDYIMIVYSVCAYNGSKQQVGDARLGRGNGAGMYRYIQGIKVSEQT